MKPVLLVIFILLSVVAASAQKQDMFSLVHSYDKFKDHEIWATPYFSINNKTSVVEVFVSLETREASTSKCKTAEDVEAARCNFFLGSRSRSSAANFVQDRSLIIIVDEKRIILSPHYSSKIENVAKRNVTSEWLKSIISVSELQQICRAKSVEVKAGSIAGKLAYPFPSICYLMLGLVGIEYP